MPLSEYEQRVLEQMEQQLRSDDPKLAQSISGAATQRSRNVVLGTLLGLAGLGMLVGGVAADILILGIVGFVAMFAGVMLAISKPHARRAASLPENVHHLRGKSAGKGGGSFMSKLEERWDKRRDEP